MNRDLRLKIITNYDSQAEFARVVGRDESIVSRVIRGRKTLKDEEKKRWALLLRCKPEEIFQSA